MNEPLSEPEGNSGVVGGVRLKKDARGLWVDEGGTVFALVRRSWSRDPETRAGVGLFSLSKDHLLSRAAPAHDFAYSCPAYQMFHYRIDGDSMFLEHVKLLAGKEDHEGFWHFISDMALSRLSDGFWEVEETSLRNPNVDLSKTPNEQVP